MTEQTTTLIRIMAKMRGAVDFQGKRYVYDYAIDEVIPQSEMLPGSDRHKASERAYYGIKEEK